MNVSLPDPLNDYVQGLISGGTYTSASEVVREGLRLLQQRNAALDALRKEIQVGIDELDRGESYSLDEVKAHLIARRRAIDKKRRQKKRAR